MIESYTFLQSVLNTITEHIVVINSQGNILFVNDAWTTFGANNNCLIDRDWRGINYLKECDEAAKRGDDFGVKAAYGIRLVIDGHKDTFYFEYPCHSTDTQRWFMMRVTPFSSHDTKCFVISHQNITERKLAEEKALHASRTDGLTNIPNRKHFNDFLHQEWRRCLRLEIPIALALIDLDHFKALNDTYGHQIGDEALISVAGLLQDYVKRPSDICARYGGEEFVIVYGGVELQHATPLVHSLIRAIQGLQIPNRNATTVPVLTASAGLACLIPQIDITEDDLIHMADNLLYKAKANGRNTLRSA